MTYVLITRGEDPQRHRKEGHVTTETDWNDAAISQGMSRNARSHKKLGRGKERFFSRGFRGRVALRTP